MLPFARHCRALGTFTPTPPAFDPSTLSPAGWWPDEWDGATNVRAIPGTLADYMTAAAYSGWAVVKVDAIVIGSHSMSSELVLNDLVIGGAIAGSTGYFGIYLRDNSGTPTVGIAHFDGVAYAFSELEIPTGDWARVAWRYDGVNVQINVDGTWGAPGAAASLHATGLTSSVYVMRTNGSTDNLATAYTSGRIREIGLLDYAATDEQIASVVTDYIVGHYTFPTGLEAPINGSPFTTATAPNGHTYTASTITAAADFQRGDGAALTYRLSKYWILGGWYPSTWADSTNRVLSSTDRITWTTELAHDPASPTSGAGARWRPRHTFGYAEMGGYSWVFGGDLAANDGMGGVASAPWTNSDVWKSADMLTWTRVTALVPWNDNALYLAGAFQSKLHVLCGVRGTGQLMRVEHWSSPDGATWTRLPDPPFQKFAVNKFAELDGKLILMGGGTDTLSAPTLVNDTWAYDGTNWARQSASAGWAGRYWLASEVYDDKLWILTGRGVSTELADAWYSEDLGVTWVDFGTVPWGGSHADGTVSTTADGITIATGYGDDVSVYQIKKD